MIDLNSIDLATLDADQLEELRESARRLLDGIEQHLEWWSAPLHPARHPFQFRENGPVYYAETVEDGVLINPALPSGFDSTSIEERSDQEMARWSMRPFIQTLAWDGFHGVEANDRLHQERLKREGSSYAAPDIEQHIKKSREAWFEAWPQGVRYDVRCLDGGSWDRSTSWGMFGTLAEALECINERCS